MWKLFFKKLWDSSVIIMLAWISVTGPIPTLRASMWLTLFLVALVGLLMWIANQQIRPEEDIQPKSILWTSYPLAAGLAYHLGPRLWHWIRA